MCIRDRFQAVGAILVIGLMIGPAVIAYLWTDSVKAMLTSSIIIGIICAVVGTEVSFTMDVSIAGSIATTIGIALIIAVIATPKTGYIATYRRQRHLRRHYRETMMLCHIYTHMDTPIAHVEKDVYKRQIQNSAWLCSPERNFSTISSTI